MAYEQVLRFYPKDMGKQKGWCLQNCRLGFHIYKPKYASAKAAMAAAKKNGTYHAGTPPNNISVPVYISTSSKNGHVCVWDKGAWWNDGRRVGSMGGVLGWDEMMDGTRVVKASSGKSFLPAKGYWARYDKDDRVAVLASFMRRKFPKYTPAKALGPIYGDNLWRAIAQFQRNTGLYPDGMTGPRTYAELQKYGFKY
jgi:peptidoglycan hydrolase-like protein with peptidoglycan-binding domain